MGGCNGEAGEDKAVLAAAAPAGAAVTPAGSPLSLQSAHKDSFVPTEKSEETCASSDCLCSSQSVNWYNQVMELKQKKPKKPG